MAEAALLGLDVGTTGTKAVAFDQVGTALASARLPTPTTSHPDGTFEHDPGAVWQAAADVLRQVAGELATSDVEPVAVATTSMAETGVLLDRHGQPTYPFIPWFDYRTEPQLAWWLEHLGIEATAAITGVVLHPMFGAPKLLWVRDNEPAAFEAGTRWLNMADWIDYQLCGEQTTDFSLASRTLVLDLVGLCWSEALLSGLGLDRQLMAPLVAAGEVVGHVHGEASAATGLRRGLPIVRGGQDHVCAALATGIVAPGQILDSIGTAEAFFMARSEPDMSGRFWPDELNQGVHVVPGQYYVMTGTGEGAGRIDAHRAELGVSFEAYVEAAAQPGPERIMIESLAFDGQALFERMVWASESDPIDHVATGGGTRIELLMELKRRIGGRPIRVPDIDEATCLGAALLAGVGVGAFDSIATAPSRLTPR